MCLLLLSPTPNLPNACLTSHFSVFAADNMGSFCGSQQLRHRHELLIKLSNCLNVATFFDVCHTKMLTSLYFCVNTMWCVFHSKVFPADIMAEILKSWFLYWSQRLVFSIWASSLINFVIASLNRFSQWYLHIRIACTPGTQPPRSKAQASKCFRTFLLVK